MKKFLSLSLLLLSFVSLAKAQQAEVTISLNEQFFDALLDAVFKNSGAVEFPLAEIEKGKEVSFAKAKFDSQKQPITDHRSLTTGFCNESIKLQREIDGVRTAVRFREGKIYAPLAFTGNYNPPLIGCIEFSGWAETNIELEFDNDKQTLIGRAKVLNVQLSGTRGLGSSLITKLVQSSIDKKINPIQILQMDKVSFAIPVQNSTTLKMKAVGMRHEITNGALNVSIVYQFQ
jgi:hypothetical protein